MLTGVQPHRPPRIVDSFKERGHEHRHVPADVIAAVRDVESCGWRDMYDRETVLMLAASRGHSDAAEWLAMRRHLYFVALGLAREEGLGGFTGARA